MTVLYKLISCQHKPFKFKNPTTWVQDTFKSEPRFLCHNVPIREPLFSYDLKSKSLVKRTGSDGLTAYKIHDTSVWIPVPPTCPTITDFIKNEDKDPEKLDRFKAMHACVYPFPTTDTKQGEEDVYKKFHDFLFPLWKYNKVTAKHIPTVIEVSILNELMMCSNYKYNKLVKKGLESLFPKVATESSKAHKDRLTLIRSLVSEYRLFLKKYRPLPQSFLAFQQDFFSGCASEKVHQSPAVEKANRLLSGGCMFMISGMALVLGLPENEILNSSASTCIRVMLEAMAHAVAISNDPESVYKEVHSGELSKAPYDEGEFDSWMQQKFAQYHEYIDTFFTTKKDLADHIDDLIIEFDLEKFTKDHLMHYVLLIEGALSGIQLWSIFLSNRYFLIDKTNYLKNTSDLYEKRLPNFEVKSKSEFLEAITPSHQSRVISYAKDIQALLLENHVVEAHDLDIAGINKYITGDKDAKKEVIQTVKDYHESEGRSQSEIGTFILKNTQSNSELQQVLNVLGWSSEKFSTCIQNEINRFFPLTETTTDSDDDTLLNETLDDLCKEPD